MRTSMLIYGGVLDAITNANRGIAKVTMESPKDLDRACLQTLSLALKDAIDYPAIEDGPVKMVNIMIRDDSGGRYDGGE